MAGVAAHVVRRRVRVGVVALAVTAAAAVGVPVGAVTSRAIPAASYLTDVACKGSTFCMVVGQASNGGPFAARFDGTRWTKLPGPSVTIGVLASVSCSRDRKSTRLNSSHRCISYAVFC